MPVGVGITTPPGVASPFGAPTPAISNRSGAPTISVNGYVVRATPRSDAEMELGKMSLSRFMRGNDAAEKRKIRERSVVAFKAEFRLMDFASFMDDKDASDLGSAVLKQQTVDSKWNDWLTSFDCKYLFEVPITKDYSNPQVVLSAPRKDLTKHSQDFTVEDIANWNKFVSQFLSSVNLETDDWVQQALNSSIESSLLVQIKQSFEAYEKIQHGGLLLYKLLCDVRNTSTSEITKLYQDFFPSYRLDNTPGEDVDVSIAGFVAVAACSSRVTCRLTYSPSSSKDFVTAATRSLFWWSTHSLDGYQLRRLMIGLTSLMGTGC
jgi:hypothetical protein